MKKFLKFATLILPLCFAPLLASAAGIMDFVDAAQRIIGNVLIPLAFALCLLYFFWGVAKYIRSASPGNKEEGKSVMIWGIVGLFVAASIWGIVALIRSELGVPQIQNVQKR